MKRHGFTLVELIAVMAVLSVVMSISAILLVQVIDFQYDIGEYSERQRAVDRLVTDFRNDVHTYGKPEILTDGTVLLRWQVGTETVEYTLESGKVPDLQNIVRTVQKGGETSHYETYRLSDRTTLHFTEGKDNDVGLVALSLWTTPKGTEMPKLDELNPFDRTSLKPSEQQLVQKYASHWRTIIARY